MTLPVQLIDILAGHTAEENMHCETCEGAGEMAMHDAETGHEPELCGSCLGSGYNQLGLILHGILKPPPEGYGPVELKDALKNYLRELAEKPGSTAELSRTLSLVLAAAAGPQSASETEKPTARNRRVS